MLDLGFGVTVFTNSIASSLGGENFSSAYGGTINGSNAEFYLTAKSGEDNADNYVADVNSTLTINCRLRGWAGFELYTGAGVAGTFALNGANDFAGNVFMNASGTISANKFGNRSSTDSGLGAGYRVRFSSGYLTGPTLKYTGVGETSDRLYEFGSNGKIEQAGTGNINLSWPFFINTTSAITIALKGSTAGTGEISGALSNGNSTAVSILKEGTGTWTLSSANAFGGSVTVNGGTLAFTRTNTYATATAINGGTLALTGSSGTIPNTSGITLGTGGTLSISNSASANQSNRVRDAAALTLNGGTVNFTHPADGASYAETLCAVSITAGANVISSSRAATGQTSALTLTSLAHTSGTVDFAGTGLGTDVRNRIVINGQADGLIGPWATVNGSALAAYSSTLGVYPAAATAYTDIAARGPSSTIPDSGATAAVRINSDGVSGAIALANTTTTIGSLLQNTATDATVDTAAKALRATSVVIPAGKAAVLIGVNTGDGTIAAATAGGALSLANEGNATLTVNAVVADNASASALVKSGAGTVKLSAANTFSGGTSIGEGNLVLANENALQNSTLTIGAAAPIFDSCVGSHAFTLGALSGTKSLSLADNSGTPIALAVGKNNASTAYSGALSGSGSLVKQGNGTLSLTGANTHQGGTTVSGGHLSADNLLALGTGPVINNGTIDFTVTPGTYSGASFSLSGSGTNNVSILGIAGANTIFAGDYNAFTGIWNIGVAASSGGTAGRVVMNSTADNAAATVNVRTNATLYCYTTVPHNPTVILQGGNTGESNGQLRLDNGAFWAGSIILAGVFTDGNDGFFGAPSGNAYLSGQISDGGNNWPVSKLGGGTLYITGTNNTFGGQFWARAGVVRVPTIRNLGLPCSLGMPMIATNGIIKLGSGGTGATLVYAGYGNTSDRVIEMASTTGQIILDHSGTNYWTMAGNVTNSGAGSKRLQLQGNSLVGTGVLAGAISDYSSAYSNDLFKTGTGAWLLSGNNTFKGAVYIENGALIARHNIAFGVGPKTATTGGNAVNNVAMNTHFHLDGSQGDLTIPAGITFRTSNQRVGAIFNDAGNNTISAKGPSVIPNDAAAIARISEEGTDGGISLAGDGVSSANGLLQATPFDAAVGLTNQTFKISSLMIGENRASLTVGTNTTDGLLMPLAAGGGLLLANHSLSGTLTINTPVTNNASASSLVKIGSGAVRLNGALGFTGATAINEGDLIAKVNVGTQSLAGVIGGNGNLMKEGPGGLTLGSANTFNGLTVIREGILMPLNNGSFGSVVGGTVITNGGTLDVGFSGTDNAVNFGNEAFTVSGTGVNGRGAIINSSVRSQYNCFRYMTLAGDATFGGENGNARWDIRNSDTLYPPYFDMNGFTVTKVGSNYVSLTSVPVLHPGNIDIQQGSFTLEVNTTLGGDSNNVMTVKNGALFDIYQIGNPVLWKLVMNDGARFVSRSGYGIAQNVWAGPIMLNGYARFDTVSGTTATLAGDISGTGSFVKIGSDLTYITGTNNTYSGGTYVSNNWLYAMNPGSLPFYGTPGKVQVASGAGLRVYSGDGVSGWTVDQLNTLHGSGTFVASNSIMAVDTTYASVTGLGNMTGFSFYKYGTNTLTLTGVNTNRVYSGEFGNLRVYAGKLVLSPASSNVYGRCYVLPGSIGATLQIDGLTTFTEILYVGNGNGDRSTVIVNTNTTASRAWVGINQIANGALIQNSGTFNVSPTTGGTQVFEIGRDGAYGYYRMNGGTLRTGQFAVGGGSGNALTANNGVFEQFGGAVNVLSSTGWLIWGWAGGNGVANLFDGTLVAPNANYLSMAHTANYGSFGMLNLLGPGAFLHTVTGSTSRAIVMANAAGNLASVINLNAGVILANQVKAGTTGTPSLFNFGGGTLRANGGTTLGNAFLQGLTATTVYPGGAVIDTTNVNITVNQPLLTPTGYGVASIAVGSAGAGYIGPPVVMISGGSGTGATAIATVDVNALSPTYGQVTGITVTSPGSGYQFSDALTVTLLRGGYTTIAQTGVPVLAPNQTTGGLAKLGSGTLTLGGTNTYGGSTVINNGTLKLGNAKALPTGTEVVLAGGTLDLNGFTVTNTLTVISGSVSNGTLCTVISPAGEGVIGDETITLKSSAIQGQYIADVSPDGACDHVTVQGAVDLSGLTLTLVDPELMDRMQVYTVLTATQKTGALASSYCNTLKGFRINTKTFSFATNPHRTRVCCK